MSERDDWLWKRLQWGREFARQLSILQAKARANEMLEALWSRLGVKTVREPLWRAEKPKPDPSAWGPPQVGLFKFDGNGEGE